MSTEPADLYAVLDVAPGAAAEELHAAYRRAARRAHPDTGEGSADEMALVNQAWARLGDPIARAAYDRARQQAPPADIADAGPGATAGEDPSALDGGPPRRVLALLALGLAVLLVAGLLLALVIGFTQGPVR